MKTGRPPLPALYTLPHGIQVVGEYAPTAKNRYWRVRIRPHPFFPDVAVHHGGQMVRRSRVVLASKLGRPLSPQEHAHHGDEDRSNDSPANVEPQSPAEHNRLHKTGTKHRPDSRARTSAALKRLYASGQKVPVPTRGSKQRSAKLDEASARSIKHSTDRTSALAARYGVSKTVIKQIRNGTIWKHVA